MSTDQQSIDWYNSNAENYTRHVRDRDDSKYHSYYEKPAMYSLLPVLTGKKVLSLGCGSGEDSAYLKSMGAEESVGIDISTEMIKIAKASHPECEFEVMSMEQLKFLDNNFDFAYSSLAIHYIENWTQVFKEVFRVLKPNSYFLFSCGHPVKYSMERSATDTDWVNKLEIKKNKLDGHFEITGDYLNRRKLLDGLGENSVNTWNKSIGEICSEIHSSGFLIEQIVEPRPTEEMNEKFPEQYKKLNKVPEFVIFKLIKKS